MNHFKTADHPRFVKYYIGSTISLLLILITALTLVFPNYITTIACYLLFWITGALIGRILVSANIKGDIHIGLMIFSFYTAFTLLFIHNNRQAAIPFIFPLGYVINLSAYISGYQMRYKRYLLLLIFTSMSMVGTSLVCFRILPEYLYNHQFGSTTPDKTIRKPLLKLYNADGSRIPSSFFSGKIVLLDFWFIGCKACEMKFPDLDAICKTYPNNKVIVVTALSGKANTLEELREYKTKYPHQFIYAYDMNDVMISELAVQGYPHEFIIDGDGNLTSQLIGFNDDIRFRYNILTQTKIIKLLK